MNEIYSMTAINTIFVIIISVKLGNYAIWIASQLRSWVGPFSYQKNIAGRLCDATALKCAFTSFDGKWKWKCHCWMKCLAYFGNLAREAYHSSSIRLYALQIQQSTQNSLAYVFFVVAFFVTFMFSCHPSSSLLHSRPAFIEHSVQNPSFYANWECSFQSKAFCFNHEVKNLWRAFRVVFQAFYEENYKEHAQTKTHGFSCPITKLVALWRNSYCTVNKSSYWRELF